MEGVHGLVLRYGKEGRPLGRALEADEIPELVDALKARF
jgi:hypothetical protein